MVSWISVECASQCTAAAASVGSRVLPCSLCCMPVGWEELGDSRDVLSETDDANTMDSQSD